LTNAGTANSSIPPEFTPGFGGIHVAQYLVFCVLFVFLPFLFWPMYCLSFDLQLLITPIVSSNFTQLLTLMKNDSTPSCLSFEQI
jgi:hypothetical protein